MKQKKKMKGKRNGSGRRSETRSVDTQGKIGRQEKEEKRGERYAITTNNVYKETSKINEDIHIII